jgi:TPR repeat protein
LGRPEQKFPTGGWQQWLAGIKTRQAGYQKDYEICTGNRSTNEAVDLFCAGQSLAAAPAKAFETTLKAAEKGYVPAQAAVGMMYATGKGVEQNYAEAGRWWTKAAEADHLLAATSLSMLYRGGSGVRGNPELASKWAKYVTDHTPDAGH